MSALRPALGRNVVHSLAGQVAPGIAALVALPLLLHGYGADRLGILHLTWVIAGAFSVLDIGVGRALTHGVATALARREPEAPIIIAGHLLLGGIGIVGGALLWSASHVLAWRIFSMGEAIRPEAESAFRLLAFAIPFVTLASGGRGVLEAQQRFGVVNAVRIPSGILMFAAPIGTLLFSRSVLPAVAATVAVRMITAIGYVWLAWRARTPTPFTVRIPREALHRLISFTWWVAAANLTGTFTQYADRLVLSARVSLTAVTYYATPMEVVTRMSVVATALMAVMFPAFTAESAMPGDRLRLLYERAVLFTLICLFPPVLLIVAFTPELLTWWLGPTFADAGVLTTRLITIGTLANALAQVPFGLLQATGHARTTAVIAAVELPVYAAVLWRLTTVWGGEGVAVAWAARMIIDAVAHFYFGREVAPGPAGSTRGIGGTCLVAAASLIAVSAVDTTAARGAVALVAALSFGVTVHRIVGLAEVVQRLRSLVARTR